mgnify:CR=1 FL=1|jgi:integrase
MASLNFFLRGEKIYFRYRPNRNLDIALATPYSINPKNWDDSEQCWNRNEFVKGAKNIDTKKLNSQIETFNNKIASFRNDVSKFIDDNPDKEAPKLKKLIKEYVLTNYFAHKINKEPKKKKNAKPEGLYELIDFYIEFRSIGDETKGTKPLAENTVKKYRTLQKVLHDYDKNLKVTEINDLFRNQFVKHLTKLKYSVNTQVKYIKDIKMLCVFANSDYNVSKQVLNWEIKSNPENVAEYVTFTFEDLKKLKETEMPTESMDNVRDFLLISCYTSVRISELLTFESKNIVDNTFLKVYEKKNRNTKSRGLKFVYLMPEVLEILKKRNGEFPRKISEQRYNEYIKKVCRIAGLTREVEGGKIVVENKVKRKIKTKEEFCELVTSHSGRATYVTLFSQYLPSEVIQMQTNHSSVQMVEHYNKTDVEELALQRAKVVAQAYKEASKKYKSVLKAV